MILFMRTKMKNQQVFFQVIINLEFVDVKFMFQFEKKRGNSTECCWILLSLFTPFRKKCSEKDWPLTFFRRRFFVLQSKKKKVNLFDFLFFIFYFLFFIFIFIFIFFYFFIIAEEMFVLKIFFFCLLFQLSSGLFIKFYFIFSFIYFFIFWIIVV